MPKEVRLVEREVEFRASESMQESDGRTMEGYAAVFGSPTRINSWEGEFDEQIAPGAFRKTLRERTPLVQYDHGKDARVGSTPIASIQELREDDQGLFIQAHLYDNPVVEPVRQAIEGGSLRGMSFRFQVMRDEWRDNENKLVPGNELMGLLRDHGGRGPLKRTVKEVQLLELGPVAFPAYASTSVGVRMALDELSEDDRTKLIAEIVAGDAEMSDEEIEEVQRLMAEDEVEGEDGERNSEAGYSVVEDHGCGEGKYAVVDKASGKNESCHPDEATAKAHVAKLMGGGGNNPMSEKKDGEPVDTEEKATTDKNSLAPTTTVTPEAKKAANGAPSQRSSRKESAMSDEQMTVEERVARQSEIRMRLSEIDTEYNGAALPEDVQEEWDNLNQEHDDHDVAIDSAQQRSEQLRRLSTDDRSTERAGSGRRAPTARRRPENIYDLNEIRSSARNVDEIGTLYRENAMRAVEQAKFADAVAKESAQGRVERLLYNVDDEAGTIARRVLVTGSPIYERAWAKACRALNTNSLTGEELRAVSLGSDPDGGYAVPFQLDPTVILDTDGVINPLRQLARVEQITGKKWQGVTTQGVTVSRSNEAAEVGDNSFTLDQPEVEATRVTGFIPFSVELESSWGAMRSEITNILADAKAQEEATSFTMGNGQGNTPHGVVATLDAASRVADMGTFGAEDVYALEEALPPRYRARGKFLGNKSVYNAIRQFASGNDGADLWVRLGAGVPNELIGYPAVESSEMSGVESRDGYLLFGDFQHFLIVDRIGMSVELVPHLFGTANNRPTGQRGVLAIWANGSDILVHNAFRLLAGAVS